MRKKEAAVTPRETEHPEQDGATDAEHTEHTEKAEHTEHTEHTDTEGAVGAGAEGAVPKTESRRFPVFTEDTARPEGGGRAAPGGAPASARQWPMLVVAVGVLTGLLVTLGSFRAGTVTVGLSLLAAGVLRWALPSVGMLAVRSRFTDVATYVLLGFGITMLAMMAQPNPWLTIPFLDDIVHFVID